ncbi:MAG: hypothetical protein ACLRWP_05720 [Bilophila wadsworthia]
MRLKVQRQSSMFHDAHGMVAENARGIKLLQPGDADVVAVQVRDQQAGAFGIGFSNWP